MRSLHQRGRETKKFLFLSSSRLCLMGYGSSSLEILQVCSCAGGASRNTSPFLSLYSRPPIRPKSGLGPCKNADLVHAKKSYGKGTNRQTHKQTHEHCNFWTESAPVGKEVLMPISYKAVCYAYPCTVQ